MLTLTGGSLGTSTMHAWALAPPDGPAQWGPFSRCYGEQRCQNTSPYLRTVGSMRQTQSTWFFLLFLKRLFIYLFSESRGGRKRGIETTMFGCLSCAPYWGPGPKPRHVSWLGIEPVTLWFAGQHSIHWATPARARSYFLIQTFLQLPLIFSFGIIITCITIFTSTL